MKRASAVWRGLALACLLLVVSGCSVSGQSALAEILPSQSVSAPPQSRPASAEEKRLIVQWLVEIVEIGDTYQIEPETVGIQDPEFEYMNEFVDEVLTVDENGLVTAKEMGIATVYVLCRDGVTGEEFLGEIKFAIGEIIAGKDYG